ncbi:MAG: hypothetical protein ACRCTA_02040 [Bacilli bacterium]
MLNIITQSSNKSGARTIIYLNNIESYIDICMIEDINNLINKVISKNNNIFIVIGTTNLNYISFKQVEILNIIRGNRVYNTTDINILVNKVNLNISTNRVCSDDEVQQCLKYYLHELFEDEYNLLNCENEIFKALKSSSDKANIVLKSSATTIII